MIPDTLVKAVVMTSKNMGQVRNTLHRLEAMDTLINKLKEQTETWPECLFEKEAQDAQ